MLEVLEKNKVDIRNISVFNFIEILNSKGIIKEYYESIPNVEVEYFSEDEENKMKSTKEFIELNNIIDKKF